MVGTAFFARDDPEEAICILKALVAPIGTDSGDILRDANLHGRIAL